MKKLTLALGIGLFAASVFAGVKDVGNGAEDLKVTDGAAWFYLRNRPLQVCVAMDSGFEKIVSKERAQLSIEQAFAKWASYVQLKGVAMDPSHPERFYPDQVSVALSCKGNEDLVFKFGVIDDEVKAHLKKYTRPVSFAVQTSFDPAQNWSRGFVWVAPQAYLETPNSSRLTFPDWSKSSNLEGIILHEVGHIYGNAHSPGTIMDENISSTLHSQSDAWRKKVLSEIDFRRELLICTHNCKYEQEGFLGGWVSLGTQPVDQEPLNFQLLMNRLPRGPVHSKVRIENKKVFLDVSDDEGRSAFELHQKRGASISRTSGTSAFKVVSPGINVVGTVQMYQSGGESLCMFLTTLSGRNISVRVQRNVGGFQFNRKTGDSAWRPVSTDLIHILLDEPEEVRILFGATYTGPQFN